MVAALILHDGDRAAIHRTLGRRMPVRLCERADALRSMLASGDARLVVSELRDRIGISVVPVLAHAAARAEAPSLVVRTWVADAVADDIIAFAATRVPARVSMRGVAPIDDAMLAALGGKSDRRPDLVILDRVGPLLSHPVRAFVIVCAVAPSPRLHVGRAAALLGLARRSLENRLASAGMPPAHRVIGWCAALHAAWRLDVLGQPRKQVATELGFATEAGVANLLARYCGCSPTSLRNHGGFQTQLERFAALVTPPLRTR